MSALAGLFIPLFYNAVGFVWNIVDDSQRCTSLEARGSGRKVGEVAIDRLQSRGSGRSIRPVCPGFLSASFAGLTA